MRENASLKVISILSMVFLPGAFISVSPPLNNAYLFKDITNHTTGRVRHKLFRNTRL